MAGNSEFGIRAARRGDAELLQKWLAEGNDPNHPDEQGWTPLLWRPYAATKPRSSCSSEIRTPAPTSPWLTARPGPPIDTLAGHSGSAPVAEATQGHGSAFARCCNGLILRSAASRHSGQNRDGGARGRAHNHLRTVCFAMPRVMPSPPAIRQRKRHVCPRLRLRSPCRPMCDGLLSTEASRYSGGFDVTYLRQDFCAPAAGRQCRSRPAIKGSTSSFAIGQ